MKLKPERVFYYFSEIEKIPRGSGNTKAVSDYCVRYAREHGFYVRQDAWNNVIIRREASAGREGEPGIILQGHLDMVAEKYPDSTHDFMKDGLKLEVEGDFLSASETTLGADDGIAIAYALAALEECESVPMLEAIFTTDEETGMDGAKNIDLSDIRGTYLLNMDSEDEGVLTAGCAGGAKAKTTIPVTRKKREGLCLEVKLSGLKGGHSGVEIHKGRGNADILLGKMLGKAAAQYSYVLIDIQGGGKDNAIPREAVAKLLIAPGEENTWEGFAAEYEALLKKEYEKTDADMKVTVNCLGTETVEAMDEESTKRVISYLCEVLNGVIAMSEDIKGLVETSLNLGILKTNRENVQCHSAVRSSVGAKKEAVLQQLIALAEKTGADFDVHGKYPAWEYRKESRLRQVLCESYEELFGEKLKVDIIHAGLECGYLLEKKPELDIVSFGPQIYDIHTTEERLSISSTEKIYTFIQKIIEKGIN